MKVHRPKTPPAKLAPIIRPALDGSDLYVVLTPQRLLASPAHVLALRALGCRKQNWASFFANRHWMIALPLGALAACAGLLDYDPRLALLSLPIAMAYYGISTHASANVAGEMARRGQIAPLMLLPEIDPFELGAALTAVRQFERGRAMSASLTFTAMAMLGSGIGGQNADHYYFIGLALLTVAFLSGRKYADPRSSKKLTITYHEIVDTLKGLERGRPNLLSRSGALWMGTFGLAALCWFTLRYSSRIEADFVCAMVCVACFYWLHRVQSEPAPTAPKARWALHKAFLASTEVIW